MWEFDFQFLSTFVAITIPLLFIAIIIYDKNSKLIIFFFCWGTLAAALAYNINNLFGVTWDNASQMSIVIAPIVEEICKALPLLIFLNRKRYPHLTKIVVFCAMASGIGFSIQESMYYFAISSREIADLAMLIARTLTTALMHGMTTATMGIGLLVIDKKRKTSVFILLGLLILAICLHSLYNFILRTPVSLVAMLIPITMFVVGWIFIRNLESDSELNTEEK